MRTIADVFGFGGVSVDGSHWYPCRHSGLLKCPVMSLAHLETAGFLLDLEAGSGQLDGGQDPQLLYASCEQDATVGKSGGTDAALNNSPCLEESVAVSRYAASLLCSSRRTCASASGLSETTRLHCKEASLRGCWSSIRSPKGSQPRSRLWG